jgi:hypothetical protein
MLKVRRMPGRTAGAQIHGKRRSAAGWRVLTNVAGQWDEVHNILQGSMAVFAIAFGKLFVSRRIRKRRETGANGS